MKVDGAQLKAIADEYKLTVNGVSFWTPYWRDEIPKNKGDQPIRGILNGKGTPAQIEQVLSEHLTKVSKELETGDDYRQFMAEIKLGVDCSGFIFYVFDQYLKKFSSLSLADHLFKPREALLKDYHNPAYTHPDSITEELLLSQPEQVSLTKIQEFWGNQPVRLAGVRILTSLAANDVVLRAGDIMPGDQIVMEGRGGSVPHHVLVTDVEEAEVVYVHSGRLDARSAGEVGGVEYGVITVTDADRPISHQQWHNQQLVEEHVLEDDCTRRLKVFIDA